MAMYVCFEQEYVEKTLKKCKKNDLAIIDVDGIDSKIIYDAIKKGIHIYGYLNIGSLEKERSYYSKFKDICLCPYDGWPGEYWVDVTSAKWQEHIISEAKKMKKLGVKGLYLDNTDVYYMAKENKINVHAYDVYYALEHMVLTLANTVGLTVMPNGGDMFVRRFVRDHAGVLKTVIQEGVLYEEFKAQSSSEKKYRTKYLDDMRKLGLYIRGIEYCKKTSQKAAAKAYYKLHGWQGLYISKHHTLKGD